MRKILSIITLLLIVACGGGGIEGYVDESISITAENPEEGKDMDYRWSLIDQPDGSLMNSSDLFSSDDGQKMSFIPDYPGDYSVEVVVSQYGDDVSTQTFAFSILDPNEKDENELTENDNEVDEPKTEAKEEWLNEDLEEENNNNDEIEDDDIENVILNDDDSYSEEEEEEEEEVEDEFKSDESEATSNVAKAIVKQPKLGSSIAARTDRYTIQITSIKLLAEAQLFSQKMIKKGYDAYIQKAAFDGNDIWYRVRVGSYDNYNSAKIAANALSGELGMATWVDFVRKEQ
ncbi:MAG: SPOR domain-containing protein [Candidatus Marinimicrobia bacterium]|jgi:cell division protein FtsN|nr:SPOR domain-containing protein [Candidatus Neomarinimicrobiota bacterium]MBT3500847.1 SPOR domain-containing protein [Candidatus Neomarinimicrobiota bacterium]MBT3838881.1 SPOR domain-containing protein [Candidatus Neomarinimicrobiota bacterium]MBT4282823.1 SPOR domain-containing protein [Candidatus Neomarinimicrobiota bacterium]MBT4579239.1 SPOR domain-containing protein [Candidatus Neomarinimicrobiota bacterium]